MESIIIDKDILAVLPTEYGKSLIFQLLPDVFKRIKKINKNYSCFHAINFQRHRKRILICKILSQYEVNAFVRPCQTKTETMKGNWCNLSLSSSNQQKLVKTEWEDYWVRDCEEHLLTQSSNLLLDLYNLTLVNFRFNYLLPQ